jgi:hypothetical protein
MVTPVNRPTQPVTRVTIRLPIALKRHLTGLAAAKDMSLSTFTAELLKSSSKEIRKNHVDLSGFLIPLDDGSAQVGIYLPSDIVQEITKFGFSIGLNQRNKLFRALLGYALEMRLYTELKAARDSRLRVVRFEANRIQNILIAAKLTLTELASIAGLSVMTVKRALNGYPVRQVTARKVLDALGWRLGETFDNADFLAGYVVRE